MFDNLREVNNYRSKVDNSVFIKVSHMGKEKVKSVKKVYPRFSMGELKALYKFLVRAKLDYDNYGRGIRVETFESAFQKIVSALPKNVREDTERKLAYEEFEDKEFWYERPVSQKVVETLK